jgi:acyl-CoA reductase-like NAD-dependent aldehyde dehydrogenase
MEDEVFGPLLPILTYSDLGKLLAKIKSLPKPLAGYVQPETANNRPGVGIPFVRRRGGKSDQYFLMD